MVILPPVERYMTDNGAPRPLGSNSNANISETKRASRAGDFPALAMTWMFPYWGDGGGINPPFNVKEEKILKCK